VRLVSARPRAILQNMKSPARNGKSVISAERTIRPANDSRRGAAKVARTAKERASRARDEIVAFKSRS
jgi:hypothetical protein